jgi:hypothetical protein
MDKQNTGKQYNFLRLQFLQDFNCNSVRNCRKDETEEEKAARLKKWSEFLTKEEQGESDDD